MITLLALIVLAVIYTAALVLAARTNTIVDARYMAMIADPDENDPPPDPTPLHVELQDPPTRKAI